MPKCLYDEAMKLFGQVELKTALLTIGMSVVTGTSTFVVAKGQIAEASAQTQRAQQDAIDRLNRRDMEREAEVVALESLIAAQNKAFTNSVTRIESVVDGVGRDVDEMKKMVKQLANK